MSWMRLEVNYLRHPKFLVLSPEAICLWHECKSYCEEHLTDGVITSAAMKSFRFFGRKRVRELVTSAGPKHPFQNDLKPPATGVEKVLQTLSEHCSDDQVTPLFSPLLEIVEGVGYRLHDYLIYNRSRQSSLERIAAFEEEKLKDRDRQRAWREKRKGFLQVFQDAPRHALDNALRPSQIGSREEKRREVDQKEEQKTAIVFPASRSKRPIFTGQRLTVFEWMLDDLGKLLGAHLDAFDLHSWFFTLDARVLEAGIVLPQRDGGAWLLAETLAEAKRRGLPIALAAAVPTAGKLTTRMAALIASSRGES